jgi:monoamine oxidase
VKELGGTIVVAAPVRHVNHDEGGVEVVSDAGT